MFYDDYFSFTKKNFMENIIIGCNLDKHDDEFDINPGSNADMIFDLNVIP